jgi:integrase
MKHISLSGRRNKSGRNRIVPLNPYILQYLNKGEDAINIFTNEEKPFNKDYFKTLWSRYKAQSNVLEELQTLYSFRHSGAIEIYKRTGSLTTLQSAMGQASLAVTLGYLRGLEIPSLKLEDMPRL